MSKLINVLRRSKAQLDSEELRVITAAFDNQPLEFVRRDPADYIIHDQECQATKPVVVILPKDRPIPTLAMEHGFVHCAVINGKLMRLVKLEPVWEEYVPPTEEKKSGQVPSEMEK